MGFFSELRATSPNISIDQLDEMMMALDFGQESSSGVRVTALGATRQSTCFSCINILSRDMAALGLEMFERKPDGGRAPVKFHPVAEWLKRPNTSMTAFQFRQLRWVHTLTYGRSFSLINGTTAMSGFRTWPIHPDTVEVNVTTNGIKQYKYKDETGKDRIYQSHRVLHTFGLSFDGYDGVSPIRWNMEAVGRAVAVGEYAASYFKSPVPKVILAMESAGLKDKKARDEFLEDWTERFAGKKGMATAAILPMGLSVAQIAKIPNNEAQFIETSRYTKEDIAQIYQVPMHRLQALDRATFSNIEHQDLEYAKYSLMPWLVSEEESIEHQFLSTEERSKYFIRHNLETLLRGDFKTRMEGHQISVGGPFRTRNEARSLENLPAMDGGDELLVPLNTAPESKWAIKGNEHNGTDSGTSEP